MNISRSISWKAAGLYKIICVTPGILGLLKLWSSEDAKKHSNVQAERDRIGIDCNDGGEGTVLNLTREQRQKVG